MIFSRLICITAVSLAGVFELDAATVTYNLDAPGFAAGTTPLINRAPNIGSSSFLTSFTSSPTAGGFAIIPVQPFSFFSGQIIVDQQAPADALTLTFNQLVDRVELNFAVMDPGRISLVTPAGRTVQLSAPLGQGPEGGTVVFSSATPFNSVRLEAFSNANLPTLFAFDNLVLNVVPEPASAALVLTGLLAAARRRRSRIQ